MAPLGNTESPVVLRTLQKKQHVTEARKSFLWGILNLCLALLMYLELSCGSLLGCFPDWHEVLWYIELCLACLFSFNTLVDLLSYMGIFSSGPVELTEYQRKLLGVKATDAGFRTPVPTHPSHVSPSPTCNPVSPSNFCPISPYALFSSPSVAGGGLHNMSHYSPGGSLSPSPTRGRDLSMSPGATPSQSGSFLGVGCGAGGSFVKQSLSQSFGPGTSFSPSFNQSLTGSPGGGALFRDSLGDSSGLRSRLHSNRASPNQSDGQIKDLRELGHYFREQEDKENRAHLSNLDTSANGSGSFWNFHRSVSDFSPMLRKYQYQIACRSPQSAKAKSEEGEEGPAQYEAGEVWMRVGVLIDEVDTWVENLRKWLGKTIFQRLHHEITSLNRSLVNIGCEDMEIGEVSISTLKQLSVTKRPHLPSLAALIPFLEVSANQEYTAKRILTLGGGGCLSDFRWKSGGEHKGKAWEQNLPTDSALVIHALCSYMDCRLPPHPKYPDGKTFTSQYFLKTPDKPNLEKKDNLLIYQTSVNPPHFKVVIGDDIWNLPKGRNNLFHAVLLFLHHVQTKQYGMLGKVNLGLSGINILWVVENS